MIMNSNTILVIEIEYDKRTMNFKNQLKKEHTNIVLRVIT